MIVTIAAALAVFLIAAARPGAGATQTEGASDALILCPQCGNHLPCNCNQHEDTSYSRHHHDQWAHDSMNQMSQDDSCPEHSHHHHWDRDGWN